MSKSFDHSNVKLNHTDTVEKLPVVLGSIRNTLLEFPPRVDYGVNSDDNPESLVKVEKFARFRRKILERKLPELVV